MCSSDLVVIKDGVHDLVLSRKDVREKVYREMESFLRENELAWKSKEWKS